MAELCDSRHFYINYDPGILFDNLRWSAGVDDNGECGIRCDGFLKDNEYSQFSIFSFSDAAGAGEMLRRDHLDRLSSVSHSRFAVVQKSFVVFPADVELLFLR